MISKERCHRDGVLVVNQKRRLLRRAWINHDADLRAAHGELRSIFDLFQRFQRDVTRVKRVTTLQQWILDTRKLGMGIVDFLSLRRTTSEVTQISVDQK